MRRYLFSLLLTITPLAYSVEPLNKADASILEQIDARIAMVKRQSLQGDTALFVPRNAAVKEGDKYFVMASSDRSIESFDRKEFRLGDTWNADFVEVKSGLRSGDYVLVKNKITERRTPLTSTLVSAPKQKPVVRKEPKTIIAKNKPIQRKPVQVKPKPKPVAIASPVKPVAIAMPVAVEPIRARPVPIFGRATIAQSPNPAPVSEYQPQRQLEEPALFFPVAVEIPCNAYGMRFEPAVEPVKQASIFKAFRHFSGRHHKRGHHHQRGHRR